MTDYVYSTTPFAHQEEGFLLSRNKEFYALLMEQGTGKSKIIIDTAAWLYSQGKIDALLVIAPNGVNRNWVVEEIPAHIPDYINHNAAWYASSMKKDESKALEKVLEDSSSFRIVTMNVEALVTKKGFSFAENFIFNFRTLLVIDESTIIKNPKAIRTKNILKLAKQARYRRILTGTPVTQGPLDIFSQFKFLDDEILGTSSYYAFRSRYAIMKEMHLRNRPRPFMNVVGYKNVEELVNLIAPHSFRVLKKECLDLPDKMYQKRFVQLSPEQRKLYTTLKKSILIELDGEILSAPLALTRLLRLQQITSGYFQPDDSEKLVRINKKNPRVAGLVDFLDDVSGKVIIWARFKAEIEDIVAALPKEAVVEYHGGIDSIDRTANIKRFQNEQKVRYFVGTVATGGKGLTLTSASTVVYFSNTFSLEDRLQSEDRAHRIGQTNNVLYVDFVAEDTLDEKIVTVLRQKKSLADLITGDNISSWI